MLKKSAIGYVTAIFGVVAVTIALEPIHFRISATTVALTLLMRVLFVGMFWGSRPAFVASVFGMLCFNYFFLPPFGTLADTPVKWLYLIIALVFAYTTITNIIERPDGIKIASFFILAIVVASFVSRALRATELRVEKIEFDQQAKEFINEMAEGEIRIVTNRRETGDLAEYRFKEHEKRVGNHIPSSDPILFYEIELGDASEFKGKLKIRGVEIEGYKILAHRSARRAERDCGAFDAFER